MTRWRLSRFACSRGPINIDEPGTQQVPAASQISLHCRTPAKIFRNASGELPAQGARFYPMVTPANHAPQDSVNIDGPRPNWALLGGVRFVLAIAVAMHHIAQSVNDGTYLYYKWIGPSAAVGLFLVISGYSVSASFLRESRNFLVRRFWRIAPVYWFALLMSYVPFFWKGPYIPTGFDTALVMPPWSATVKEILFLQPAFSPFPSVNYQLWSVGVETAFYLTVPFLVRCSTNGLIALAVASGAAFCLLPASFNQPSNLGIYRNLYWLFVLGVILYRHRTTIGARFFMWGALIFAYWGTVSHDERGAVVLCSIVGGLIVFGDRIQLPQMVGAACEYLGDLSYPLYATHWGVAWMVSLLYLDVQTPTVLLACMAVAVIILHVIDKPFRRGRTSHEISGVTNSNNVRDIGVRCETAVLGTQDN